MFLLLKRLERVAVRVPHAHAAAGLFVGFLGVIWVGGCGDEERDDGADARAPAERRTTNKHKKRTMQHSSLDGSRGGCGYGFEGDGDDASDAQGRVAAAARKRERKDERSRRSPLLPVTAIARVRCRYLRRLRIIVGWV
jgi:hypothetical protein